MTTAASPLDTATTARPPSRRMSGGVLRLVMLGVALVAAVVIGIRAGAVDLTVEHILLALAGRGDPTTVMIVQSLRLPRVLQAGLVGAMLSVSGSVFQALLRNPLADPYILGVSSGAAVGAVGTVVLGLAVSAWTVPFAAFAGAIVAIVLVLRISASVGRSIDTHVMLLAGVVVGAFFDALILLFLTFADLESFRTALFWMMGSNSRATWGSVQLLTVYATLGVTLFIALSRPLNLLAIGEDTAAFLGTSPERTKLIAYGGASFLAAAAVAMSGIIGFIALIVPHVVRLLWGGNYRFIIPASALLGASGLICADVIARTVARPMELPIGVVTAICGVPFFVWLLRTKARNGAAG